MPKKTKKNLPSATSKSPQPPEPSLTQLVEARLQSFSGPLPDPATLRQFDDVLPGTAERIISMAERQQSHRQLLERTVIVGDSKRAMWGLGAGVFVTVAILAVAAFLIYTGHDWAGAIIGGLDIIGLVSVFVYGTVSRRGERAQKAAIANQPR